MEAFDGSATRVLSGDISVISIAEVLQLLHLQRQTGSLTINAPLGITLYMSQGCSTSPAPTGCETSSCSGATWSKTARSRAKSWSRSTPAASSRPLLGEALQAGLATEEQLKRALMRQTSDLVYEVVRWKRGRFAFVVDSRRATRKPSSAWPRRAHHGRLPARRRVALIEGSFDFDEVLYRDETAIDRFSSETKLTKQEALARRHRRRAHRPRDRRRAGLGSFEACKFLYQFLNSRLVRRKAA